MPASCRSPCERQAAGPHPSISPGWLRSTRSLGLRACFESYACSFSLQCVDLACISDGCVRFCSAKAVRSSSPSCSDAKLTASAVTCCLCGAPPLCARMTTLVSVRTENNLRLTSCCRVPTRPGRWHLATRGHPHRIIDCMANVVLLD